MCGIAGIIALTDAGTASLMTMEAALPALHQRGPDSSGIFKDQRIVIGHTRLSIIDTSTGGSQPMTDPTGRYTIVFNGEFFNFKQHRDELIRNGVQLHSSSDTEVLLQWYILEKEKCLQRINGFFSFAVYDSLEKSLFLARDRMGVKPLVIYQDENRLLFASELKALMKMGIPKTIDPVSLFTYFQLNYIPGTASIFRKVRKPEAGTFLTIKNIGGTTTISEEQYYEIKRQPPSVPPSYENAQSKLKTLLDDAVQRRLIADVPLGAFLSGGIDSSVIVGLAARHQPALRTFSIGFKDEPMFDETRFAEAVAKKHKTDHRTFRLTNNDLLGVLFDTLDYIDEPFADSSALNMFLLSRETRKHVTVSLSGDGADEIFGGYNKHAAEWRMRHRGTLEKVITVAGPLWNILPKSRNTRFGNIIRQLYRFSKGSALDPAERYWMWASIASEEEVESLVGDKSLKGIGLNSEYINRKQHWTRHITGSKDLNDVFRNDTELVLQHDMLVKVDSMSMANSLEVRSPFLDYTVVDFAFTLPAAYKIDRHHRKKIIRDTFGDLLPDEILRRKKQGFEVPLLKWFRNELRSLITDDLLEERFVLEQGLFDPAGIRRLLQQLFSNNPGDAVARVWALIVFQYWWKRNLQHHD